MKILFYDIETTGLDYIKDGIIQISGILTKIDENNKLSILDKFSFNMFPENKRIELSSFFMKRFSIEQINSFEKSSKIFIDFKNILSKHCDVYNSVDKITLCGYNSIFFDNMFLRQWFKDNNDDYYGGYFWQNSIDIMSQASNYFLHYRPAILNFKLETIADIFDIKSQTNEKDDPFYKIKLTMKIFLKLINSPVIKPWDEKIATEMFNKKIELNSNKQQSEFNSSFYEWVQKKYFNDLY